ncbi:MAG: Asp-tRNA(Asn)/Glu-tRNA(Gln) amidotransferase subunit GatC [Clostridia bacterium]|nr:Asp-tRNA(Asn)/Glu-tRNA(Gln) amidotransferase subunit GatC [Clostridia bacterium]
MDREILRKLEMLNQLKLTEEEKDEFLAFYEKRENQLKELEKFDTSSTERMVHVMPIETVIREDKVCQTFTREELQKGAVDTDEGYWCVPRVVE